MTEPISNSPKPPVNSLFAPAPPSSQPETKKGETLVGMFKRWGCDDKEAKIMMSSFLSAISSLFDRAKAASKAEFQREKEMLDDD